MKQSMKIGRRGKDLAVRFPIALVRKYNLKVGDSFDSEVFARAIADTRLNPEPK
jgi:antitoxin component of MazEF toxin-antitoxin module